MSRYQASRNELRKWHSCRSQNFCILQRYTTMVHFPLNPILNLLRILSSEAPLTRNYRIIRNIPRYPITKGPDKPLTTALCLYNPVKKLENPTNRDRMHTYSLNPAYLSVKGYRIFLLRMLQTVLFEIITSAWSFRERIWRLSVRAESRRP